MADGFPTRSAMPTDYSRDADAYCPECGRPWREPSPDRPYPEAAFPWRAAFLAAVGLVLALTFGVRAVRAAQEQAVNPRDLAVLARCLGHASPDPSCPSVEAAQGWRGRYDVGEAMARRQRDLALVPTALGLFAVGLSSLARLRRVQDRPRSPLAAVWKMGESMTLLTCLQVLGLTLHSIASQLSQGLPFTWERLDTAADNVLALVSFLTGPHF
jgi:hypothetical protein